MVEHHTAAQVAVREGDYLKLTRPALSMAVTDESLNRSVEVGPHFRSRHNEAGSGTAITGVTGILVTGWGKTGAPTLGLAPVCFCLSFSFSLSGSLQSPS